MRFHVEPSPVGGYNDVMEFDVRLPVERPALGDALRAALDTAAEGRGA